MNKLNLLACASSLLIAPLNAAQAAESAPKPAEAAGRQSAADLSAIIVTATRREEALKTVPISVTAVSATNIVARGITNIQDLAPSVPGLMIGPAASSQNAAAINIRGQLQRNNLATVDPSVGVYADDVYLARAYSVLTDLLDVDRVEVLRGPQGTLFGRNTIGGAVRVISRKPKVDEGLTGNFFAGVGDYGLLEIGGAVTLPIVKDRLAIRYAGARRIHDGYTTSYVVTEPFTGPASILRKVGTNDEDMASHRLSVAWLPTDTTKIDASYYYFNDDSHGLLIVSKGGDIGRGTSTVFNSPQHAADFYSGLTNVDPVTHTRSQIASVTMQQEITDNITFKAIGSYSKSTNRILTNGDGIVTDSNVVFEVEPDLRQHQDQYTGELQLSGTTFGHSLDWIGGVYYFKENAYEFSAGNARSNGSSAAAIQYEGDVANKSQSAYLSFTVHPTRKLTIRAGGRYTEDTKGIVGYNKRSATQICIYTPGPGVITSTTSGGPCSLSRTDKFHYATYDLSVDYKVNDNVFLYAKTNDGDRGGGEQLQATSTASSAPFGPDKVVNYEAGIKSTLFDRLTVNAAVFHVNYTNVQQTSIVAPPLAPTVTSVIVNQGSARVNGFEAEGSLKVFDGFRVDAGVGYNDMKYADPKLQQVFNPKWKYSISGTYVREISSAKLTTSVNFDGNSSWITTDRPVGAFADTIDGHSLWSARMALLLKNGLELSIWGRNLADTHYFARAIKTGVFAPAVVGDPRTLGAMVRYTF